MSRLVKALRAIENHPHSNCPCAGPIANYIETGDHKALKKVTAKGCHNYYLANVFEAVGVPVPLLEEDRRLLEAFAQIGLHDFVFRWVAQALRDHWKPDENYYGTACAAYGSEPPAPLAAAERVLEECWKFLLHEGRPTSAGRSLLALDDTQLDALLETPCNSTSLLEVLLASAPDRVPARVDKFVFREGTHNGKKTGVFHLIVGACAALVAADRKQYEPRIAKIFETLKNIPRKFELGGRLAEIAGDKYRDPMRDVCVQVLQMAPYQEDWGGGHKFQTNPPWENAFQWLLDNEGEKSVDALTEFAASVMNSWFIRKLLENAAPKLGAKARPIALAAANRGDPELQYQSAALLVEWNDPADEEPIAEALRSLFESRDAKRVMQAVGLAGRWKPDTFESDFWQMLSHSSKLAREAAARALGTRGDAAVKKAGELLAAKKGPTRAAAVVILRTAQTPEALRLLEARLDEEPDDEVRDSILHSLDAVWTAQGRKITRDDIAQRVARSKSKAEGALPAWLDPAWLPALRWTDGTKLDEDTVRYLLYRQSRAKEMRADVEARPLLAMIDRASSGDFALQLLKAFLGSGDRIDAGDRWAMALACLLGDDRVVPVLNGQVRDWVDHNRGKLAEYAAQALALVGSDAALCVVDGLSIKYRSKQKNIGKAASEAFVEAAERLGITADELGDRVVPWLGFEPGKPRVLDAGKTKIEVRVAPDFKFVFHDMTKNKKVASLPAGVGAETKAEFKELGATLREVLKGQLLRLENLMVRQFRWPVARWRELFLEHPILFPFAQRLVWGIYDADGNLIDCFRALEDRTLTDETDGTVELPKTGSIGIVHPLELDEASRQAWQSHLTDYDVESPFPQMERPVVQPAENEANLKISKAYRGTSLNALTFRSRAEKLGWQRGSVQDAGSIPYYIKTFPGAGADAFLCLEGMYIGAGMDAQVDLQEHYFVRSGSVVIGSYTYDEPRNDSDERLVPFGQVPPIVYSEVAGDLQKISGSQMEDEA